MFFFSSDGMSVQTVLQRQRAKVLPVDRYHYQRIYVRRKHVWEDTLNAFKSGLDFGKYIKVTFAGTPAVDDGGPLREFLRLMMGSIAMNNMLFQGESTLRVPTCNVAGLENKLYERIGEVISVSLIHGGPAPTFLLLLWLII